MVKGLPYFPLACQLDERFELIEAEFGLSGFAVLVKLLQRIFGEKGYYCEWNPPIALLMARRLGMAEKTLSAVVQKALELGLFDQGLFERSGVLSSRSIQQRYFEAVSRRKSVEVQGEYLLLRAEVIPKCVDIFFENADISAENADIFRQRKEKKTKEEKRKQSAHTPAQEGGAGDGLEEGKRAGPQPVASRDHWLPQGRQL